MPLLLIVTAMLAPYAVAAALTAALPGLRRRIGKTPSTGQMVARFFDARSSLSLNER
jgi:hypothetical protein